MSSSRPTSAARGPRYVCVHGHFYQPPRENPWLDAIEEQPSARPFHDWNARVSSECYRPNAFARILDGRGRIERIVNNYQRISWNFGPTLLSWMQRADPELYRGLQEADAERIRVTGHGAGMAQAYGHAILPLCQARDQETHVRWGIADFQRRFARRPRGMWLAETACDTPSLEALAQNGIEFTVLAPHQALKGRSKGGRWQDARGGKIDPRRPYLVHLPSGRSISVFFYDGPTSRAVAFERVLDDGARFAERLTSTFDARSSEAQLVHIATDGESYGHHHRFGEMALAFALSAIEAQPGVSLTTYEEMLERHPPTYEAAIVEGSSWSCAHGVERWRSDCGCSNGGQAGWNQAWRAPLRFALDVLRDSVNQHWERAAAELLHDPWGARDRYIELLLDPAPEIRERFLSREVRYEGPIPLAQRQRVLELLELQRHLILMYTSCGWFFADLGGIETVQILRYAARALELATAVFGDHFRGPFLAMLGNARTNPTAERPDGEDGASLFTREAAASAVDLPRAAAHFAARSLFESGDATGAPGFSARSFDRVEQQAGRARLALGKLEITERATEAQGRFEFAAVHLGDHNLGGGVRTASEDGGAALSSELLAAFRRYELPQVLRTLERHFEGQTFTLRSLFFDEQARVLDELLRDTRIDVDHAYQRLYEEHAPLMRYLASLGQEPPVAMRHAATFALSSRIEAALTAPAPDLAVLRGTLEEARATGTTLDALSMPALTRAFARLVPEPSERALDAAVVLAELLQTLPKAPHHLASAEEALVRARDAGPSAELRGRFVRLGELLGVAVD